MCHYTELVHNPRLYTYIYVSKGISDCVSIAPGFVLGLISLLFLGSIFQREDLLIFLAGL